MKNKLNKQSVKDFSGIELNITPILNKVIDVAIDLKYKFYVSTDSRHPEDKGNEKYISLGYFNDDVDESYVDVFYDKEKMDYVCSGEFNGYEEIVNHLHNINYTKIFENGYQKAIFPDIGSVVIIKNGILNISPIHNDGMYDINEMHEVTEPINQHFLNKVNKVFETNFKMEDYN